MEPVLDRGFDARLGMDAAGNAVVAVTRPEGLPPFEGFRIVAFTRSASGGWSGPVAVSELTPGDGGPSFALNAAGEGVVTWIGRENGLKVVRASMRLPDGTWTPPENLGYAGFWEPRVAIDSRGDAVALWFRGQDRQATVYAEYRPRGGPWGPAEVLSQRGAGEFTNGAVVMNANGDAVALWGESTSSGTSALVSSARSSRDGTWSQPSRVPVTGSDSAIYASKDGDVAVALDGHGAATVVAQAEGGRIEAATRRAGAADWEAAVVVGDGGSGGWWTTEPSCVDPRVAVDASGDTVVIWGGAALYAARREAGSSTWEKPVTVAPGPVCFSRAVAIDPAGDAIAIWNAGSGAATRLDSAVLDATPPRLAQLTVPSAARAKQLVGFSVAATDAWSSVGSSPVWDFGDGTTARGSSVLHTYRRPRSYRVRVSVEDLAGNRVTAAARIRITPSRAVLTGS